VVIASAATLRSQAMSLPNSLEHDDDAGREHAHGLNLCLLGGGEPDLAG
jgi:hypothetical protein